MNYLTFIFKDPTTFQIKCVGVKYKKTLFNDSDISRLLKSGTSNSEVKEWLKQLRKEGKVPLLEILYQGSSSVDACQTKQLILINCNKENVKLIGQQAFLKKYTKKLRTNDSMRRKIKDQNEVEYPGILEAAERLLLAPSNISKVLHGKLEHIGGFKFTFV